MSAYFTEATDAYIRASKQRDFTWNNATLHQETDFDF